MATGDDTKLPLTSCDVHEERLAQFRQLFPEAFSEGKTDLKRLTQLLGDAATDAPERYGLSWAGKSDAIRAIQITSPGTLLPVRGESVNFDVTENLIIEGDNLEVLKLLQGGYHERVKMIYIDPPYNTGGEFIYPDNYKEGLADYLKFSRQVSGEGIKLTTNTETDGRYHSKWLTMMYPRLFLARNLLREDGVIFVSIDDHEVHNLRAVMNEIFGEENCVCTFAWEKRYSPPPDTKEVGYVHESIVFYRKSDRYDMGLLPFTDEQKSRYKNPDNDERGSWKPMDYTCRYTADERPSLYYAITNPSTGGEVWPKKTRVWAFSKEVHRRNEAEKRIWWGADGRANVPALKNFISEIKQGMMPMSLLKHELVGNTDEATKELRELFPDLKFTPKPVRLIKHLCAVANLLPNDIVLDFFAGSGTTAQAVLESNAQDGGNRKFILVQLPEPMGRMDFPTIADITKERVRRVIQKVSEARTQRTQDAKAELNFGAGAPAREADLGFKLFKLSSSNFKVWDVTSVPKDGAGLAEQLKLMAHNVEEGRPDEALLYELVLKSNLRLASKIQSGKIGAQTFYDVADGTLAICLERPVQQEALRGLVARKPKGVVCLDIAFAGNDQLKANTVLEMKSHGIEFHTA